jgi:hypothetical protein
VNPKSRDSLPKRSFTQILDVVALPEDLLSRGLVRGQVGTIVEDLDEGVFEVEFSDDNGRTCATLALCPDQLLVLLRNQFAAA